jgi:hypothetical protein
MTTLERYEKHLKRSKEYDLEFRMLLQELDITELKKDRLHILFEWYGHSRAMQSKEYQQLKKENG